MASRAQRPGTPASPLPDQLLKRLLGLSGFSRDAVAAADDLSIYRLAVQVAREVLDGQHAAVLTVDAERGSLRIAAAVGLDPVAVERFALPAGEGLAGQALRERRVLSARAAEDRRFVHLPWQTDSPGTVLCIPLFLHDEPLGVLCVGRGPQGFARWEEQVAELLGNLLVAAVENGRLLRQARRRLQEVSTLLETGRSIQSAVGLDEALATIVREAVHVVQGAECGSLFLVGNDARLSVQACIGYPARLLRGVRLGPGEGYPGEVLRRREGMVFHELAGSPLMQPLRAKLPPDAPILNARSAAGVPVCLGTRVVGVLVVESLSNPKAFDDDDLRVLTGLASHAAIAVERNRLYEQRRNLYLSGIRTLVAAVDARDPSARGHSDRVAFYSRRIAQAMGMAPDWVERVELAALLHDVGKIGIADSVLRKPGPLDPAERAVMMAHVELGAQILAANEALSELVPLVRHHHEWYSGGGYPDGLAGDAIPLGAAIISVADAFDTMTTGRPYRPAVSLEQAMAELKRWSGVQFRPDVVEALERALGEDEEAGAEYIFQLRQWVTEVAGAAAGVEYRALRPDSAAPGDFAAPASGREGAAGAAGDGGSQRPGAGSGQEVAPGRGPGPALQAAASPISPIQTRELAALYRMTQVVRDVLDLPTLVQHILRIIDSELQMANSCVFLADDETGELVMAAGSGSLAGFEGLRLSPNQGVNGWVFTHGLPVLVPDVSKEPRYFPGPPTTRSEVVVPLTSGGKVLGTLTVDSPVLDAFSLEEVRALTAVAQQAAVAIEVAKLHQQATRAALRDGLTDLFNHRHFYERLEDELERAERYGYGLQVVIGDVDGLKEINDNLGHLAGDSALSAIAGVLRRHCRRYDVLARYGGDEFSIVMPQTDRQGALQALARLDQALSQATFNWSDLALPLPSISWGVAGFPEDGRRASELVAVADARMYHAKRERQFSIRGRSMLLSGPTTAEGTGRLEGSR